MPVRVQKTPNPNALKFVLPAKQFEQPLNISTAEQAERHPLAQKLLALDAIYNVFMVQDFITVNKMPDVPWTELEDRVQQIIAAHFGLEDYTESPPTDPSSLE